MRTLLGVALFLIACTGAPPSSATKAVIEAPAAVIAESADPATPPPEHPSPEPYVEVHSLPATGLVELPRGFVLDGLVGEWDEGIETKLVLTQDGLTIAGKLMKETPQEETITVVFQFGVRPLPTVGVPLRGGGVFELNCETTWDGQPLEEPESQHCQGMMTAANQFRDAWAAESFRTWRLGPAGVTTPKGEPVPGATSIVKKGADITFEAHIPIAALPLAIEAPVTSATVFITTELSDPNPNERNLVGVIFGDDGVRFGALTDLRQRALEEWGLGLADGVPAVAYRLGNDATWIIGRRAPGWLNYERVEVPVLLLDTSFKSFGVGRLYAGTDRLVTVKDNKVVAIEGALSGEILGSVKRAPGLHLFIYDEYRDEVGQTIANWTVHTIDGEGQISGGALGSPVSAWRSVEPFHTKDLKSFGLVGDAAFTDGPSDVRVTYGYVPSGKWYEPKTTGLE